MKMLLSKKNQKEKLWVHVYEGRKPAQFNLSYPQLLWVGQIERVENQFVEAKGKYTLNNVCWCCHSNTHCQLMISLLPSESFIWVKKYLFVLPWFERFQWNLLLMYFLWPLVCWNLPQSLNVNSIRIRANYKQNTLPKDFLFCHMTRFYGISS